METELNRRIACLLEGEKNKKNSDRNQKALADAIGVPDGTLSRWILKGRDIPAKHLPVIADFFGVSTDYLLGRTDNIEPVNSPGKKKEPLIRHDKQDIEGGSAMDMDSFIKSVKEKAVAKANQELKEKGLIEWVLEKSIADFEGFFMGYGFVLQGISTDKGVNCMQAMLDNISESAILLTYASETNEQAKHARRGDLIDFLISVKHPKETEYRIAVCTSSRPDKRFDYVLASEGSSGFEGITFDSLRQVLESIFPSSKDSENEALKQELKAVTDAKIAEGKPSTKQNNAQAQ